MSHKDINPQNAHSVPKKQWKKWTMIGKNVFNKTYEYMMENPDHFKHPNADLVPTEFFKITAWNAAWIAADICSRGEKHYIKEITKELKG